MDILELAAKYLPDWIGRKSDRDAWLEVFAEAFEETQDEEMAALAATGRVTKRRILGLKSVEGAPVIAGWGLLFTSPDDPDLSELQSYFDEDTPLLLEYYQSAPLFYEHGEDPAYGVRPIGQRTKAVLYPRGVWAEHTLDTTHPLFERTRREAENGELAYSSDSIAHLAEKEYDERDGRLGFWAIAGWSLTRNPAEPALGAVSLKQFAGALKRMAREAHSGDGATQPQQLTATKSGDLTMQPNELLAALTAALGLTPDASPEEIRAAVDAAIAELSTNPAAAASMHAAMGGEATEKPNPEDLAEKMNHLYKMACEPDAGKDAAPPPPEPMPASMSAERSAAWGKAIGLAGKSAPNGSGMPYMVNATKGQARDYATRGVPNVNYGAKEPGVFEIVKDMMLVRSGMQPQTFRSAKAMSYATGPAGGYVLSQSISEQILDPLRAESVAFNLGARREDFDGIQIQQVPAMQSAPDAYWVGEGQTVTDSQPVYRMITMVPKPLACLVQRPFNFYKNMTGNSETQLRNQIKKSMALKIDFAALMGTGGAAAAPNTGSSPVGLLNMSGVTQTTLATNGRQPNINDLIGCEKRVDAANVPTGGERGWAFHTNVKHVFTGMSDAEGQPIFREAWGKKEGRELLGWKYETSNQIPTNVTTGSNANTSYIFYGEWQYMVIGMTTEVELVLDQTYAAQLLQGLLAYVYVDVAVDYAQAFQVLKGVTYS